MAAAATILPATLIKDLGYWKSNTYETYVQSPPSSLHAVISILATQALNLRRTQMTQSHNF